VNKLSFLLIEFIKGEGSSSWPSETNRFGRRSKRGAKFHATLVKDIALFMTKMATKTYDGVGTLTFDAHGKIVVGPLRPVQLEAAYPALHKVYPTSAACYIARIDHFLRLVREGAYAWDKHVRTRDPVWTYVVLLEARDLIGRCQDLNRCEPTYIRHGDDHIEQFLTKGNGHLRAILDWE
jgi:hypothetical protein